LRCQACAFTLFFNPASAVGAFVVRPDGQMLWLQRAREPGRGKLGLAGGFIDIGETAEEALARELDEEVGLTIRTWRFLCSAPNDYAYADVCYPVCDLFFEVQVDSSDVVRSDESEVAGWVWLPPEEVRPDQIAFKSVRAAFAKWRSCSRSP
jgi:ADP-ribose pyrophosphatase YjhB (NUDIX family)